MKKILNSNLTLFFSNNFPYKSKYISYKKNRVTIGIGGNISDVKMRFNLLFNCFKKDGRFTIIKTSPILKNPPFGFLNQDYFYNAVIILKTNANAYEVLKIFQKYEIRFKRERSFKDAPRTLDIDIIFFNKLKISTKNLIIPHKEYKNRDSVMLPLSYLFKKGMQYG